MFLPFSYKVISGPITLVSKSMLPPKNYFTNLSLIMQNSKVAENPDYK